jgi:ATP:ADP antiporter, AAA family
MRIVKLIQDSTPSFKKNLFIFLAAYFFVLLNYPLVRSAGTTFFLETFGAKSSPIAWVWSVLFLSVTVYVSNRLQARMTVQRLFFIVTLLSLFIFASATVALKNGSSLSAYGPFIWKDIYIVLQVHLLLAYGNNYFRKQDFKLLIGLIGGVGSLGGVLGGYLTSLLGQSYGTEVVMWLGLLFTLIPAVLFMLTSSILTETKKHQSPMATLTPAVKMYVFWVAAVVATTQFIINIADLQFNLAFEAFVIGATQKTTYQGYIHMATNAVTFIFQFLLVPLILPRVTEKNYHLSLPLAYGALLGLLLLAPMGFFPVASFFILLKASDYSFFSSGKEVLYQPLSSEQKYGAKYLTDMLVYRVAKAVIAAVLIYLQSSFMLNMMMVIFLAVWIILIIQLFKLHRQLNH